MSASRQGKGNVFFFLQTLGDQPKNHIYILHIRMFEMKLFQSPL